MDWKAIIKNVPLDAKPQLLLDQNALESNIVNIEKQANGKNIRLATKSIRSIPVLHKILSSSSTFKGLMCFTASEALFLVKHGFDDVLIGYPTFDKKSLQEIATLNLQGNTITCMVDSKEHIELLTKVQKENGGQFYTCIEMDMSNNWAGFHFGVRRSPLKSPKEVIHLAKFIDSQEGVFIKGLMGYEAQIAGVTDSNSEEKMRSNIIKRLKKKSIPTIAKRREQVHQLFQKNNMQIEFFNGGGTGSLQTTSQEKTVTEVTVGSGFFAPLLFDQYRDFQYEPALFFSLPIVRQPKKHIYTCLGGGYIGSGSIGEEKQPQPVYPSDSTLISLEGVGEVQTPIQTKVNLSIGDSVIFRAAKAGEICERFSEILVIDNGKWRQTYPTYRGEGECFL
ncbi:amino acid deaminase/aldolase [Oceanobacillus kimchii]|uniref:amino acid deaminase/aldolase n=1 Tax=Oceanobacillus kimchii TaxID=746691 RepID=UPI0021A28B5E|nr:amino acid deaminase/aldolase [Oceanobacillus kimchii]MCT1576117.1 amino acid deaminase/aldolase [Oceanobacillus kimchii]MCT2135754.1 amino acid deaminase/aldolase [Oceanobacillus kimchii]